MTSARIGFVLIALALTGAVHVYLFRRLVRDTAPTPRRLAWGKRAILGLWLLLAIGPVLFFAARSPLTELLSTLSWVWLGLSGFLLFLFVVADLIRLGARLRGGGKPPAQSSTSTDAGFDPERRLFLSRALAGGALAASAGFGAYGVFRAYSPPEITELALKLPRLSRALDGFSIVQVSDIHAGPLIQRRFLEDMVRRCNALKPDLVAITGDLVDGSVRRLLPEIDALTQLRSRFGSYFVTGNHEYYSGDRQWSEALARLGIGVLRNRWLSIGAGAASFDLIGVDDWRGVPGRRYDLELATHGRNLDRAAVLLAHQPKNFEAAAAQGIGLQLSGHTHGGQLFPMTALIRLMWERPSGLYAAGDSRLYVSRGTGFWGPPMRVGSPPEIVKVTLLAG